VAAVVLRVVVVPPVVAGVVLGGIDVLFVGE